jgi:hypothetical protein
VPDVTLTTGPTFAISVSWLSVTAELQSTITPIFDARASDASVVADETLIPDPLAEKKSLRIGMDQGEKIRFGWAERAIISASEGE